MNLTIEQRNRLRDILPKYPEKPVGRKRADILKVFEGILWVLESGARWEDIDKKRFAAYQTCHRYFQEWVQSGLLQQALSALVQEAESEKLVQLQESFVDGSFVRAKRGGAQVGYCHKGKGSRLMALVDANGLPISLSLHAANPHEVTLTFDLVQNCWTEELPERVIGDKAFDSDALDEELAACGVEMIAAHRKNRKKPKTQDGRKLRRGKRRWKVERFFAHLQNFRRMVVRYEYKAANFLGFVLLAAIIMHVRYRF